MCNIVWFFETTKEAFDVPDRNPQKYRNAFDVVHN